MLNRPTFGGHIKSHQDFLVTLFLLLSSKFRSGSSLPVLRTTKCDAFSEARRTKNRLLRYGMSIRCSKRPPGVRDASSEAFGVKNRRFWYGRDIQCAKQASVVRDAFSKARRTADSTDCGQPPAAPDAFSEACRAKSSLLPHRTHLQCAKRPARM